MRFWRFSSIDVQLNMSHVKLKNFCLARHFRWVMRFWEMFHLLVFLLCLLGKLVLAFVYHEDVEVLSFLEVQLNLFSLELMKLLLVTAPQVSPSFDKYQLKNEAFERNVGLLRGGCLPSLEIGNNTHWRPNRHRKILKVKVL
uniref:Uncharacterized protein n=1 Tax=Solanum lycopersicum TaxID=4081 RepID=K4BAS3_SOLLC